MNKLYEINDIFSIPHGENYILYAPYSRRVLLANSALLHLLCDIEEKKVVDYRENKLHIDHLLEGGFIKNIDKKQQDTINNVRPPQKDIFLPTHVTLFLTGECNLACKYCYGDAGNHPNTMDLEIGLEAIDLIFLNAAKNNYNSVYLGFHGGGEPTLQMGLIKKLVEHANLLAKRRNVRIQKGITTNGVMPTDTARWIIENIDQVNFSFDGPEEIQDFQRPKRNLKGSFPEIDRTLRLFQSNNKPYHLRGTITNYSASRIEEIVQFIANNYSPKVVQLEPMSPTDRSKRSEVEPPNDQVFINGFIKAQKIAQQSNFSLTFSGLKYPSLVNSFCGVGLKNFSVTPEGKVTSCFEVLQDSDSRSDLFFFGQYDKERGFLIDEERLERIRDFSLNPIDHCKNCFANPHCAGDCRAKGLYLNDISDYSGGGRCEIIQNLIKAKLIEQIGI